ncbi:hypothetical protein KGQ27_02070 [Patescibacteria group bacterium]|nr:hypothetical protein [Patescibacteria group bacterium]MDE1946296.1 hypothetical protein [Patescibacteria group bacterium]MDE2010748.1 hypothetical protein [Patescibacteria group bacterium]MDE2232632.1 hypothetical protein [Patescibacteria group bacterium]
MNKHIMETPPSPFKNGGPFGQSNEHERDRENESTVKGTLKALELILDSFDPYSQQSSFQESEKQLKLNL